MYSLQQYKIKYSSLTNFVKRHDKCTSKCYHSADFRVRTSNCRKDLMLPVHVLRSFSKYIPFGQEQLNDPGVLTQVSFKEHLFKVLFPHSLIS